MDNTDDQERLVTERARLEVEVQTLAAQQRALEGQIQEAEAEKQRRETALKAAQEAMRQTEKQATIDETRLATYKGETGRAEQALKAAQHNAGQWAEELPYLPELTEESARLGGAKSAWELLQGARQVEHTANTMIAKSRKSLGKLPPWSLEERVAIRQKGERLAQRRMELESERQAAAEAHRVAADAFQDDQQAARDAGEAVRTLKIQIGDLSDRVRRAEADLNAKVIALPEALAGHHAVEDRSALAALEGELEGLTGADDEEKLLRVAERRRANLAGQIQAAEEDLAKIPGELRRPVEAVTQECAALTCQAESADQHHANARDRLAKLSAQKETFERMVAILQEASREYVRWDKLARPLGRSGLQAQILRMAQEAVQANANTTLYHLTGGDLKVALPDGDIESGMEIQIQDTTRPSEPRRSFEYLSGGEKFRVAVAFAVAIGQSFSGGRAVDTLIIDEGFGALDEPNRGRLVEELRRLSEELLRGGRVIVVSHQDDVAGEFGSCYRITKTDRGHILLEYNPD